jgi:phosphoesterase RecJ-like protein
MLWELVRRSGIRAGRDLATNLYAAILTDTGRFSFSNTTPRVLRMAADLLALGVRPAEVARPLFRNRTQGDLRLLGACMRALRFSSDGRIGWLWLTRDRIRRAGAKPRDSQEYIEIVKSVRGVEVALLFRNTDEPGLVKLSIRTETGVDASALAAAFGGGGHPRAGGATIPGSGRAVERRVLAEVRRRLPRRRPQRRLRSLPNPLSQEHP